MECCKGLAPEQDCACARSRIAELEAALKMIASGMQGDRFLADWELSDIASKALTPKRDQ